MDPIHTREGNSWIYPAYAQIKEVMKGINSDDNLVDCFVKIECGVWIPQTIKLGKREVNLKRNVKFIEFMKTKPKGFFMMTFEQETPEYGYPYDNLTFPGGKRKGNESRKDTATREFIEELLLGDKKYPTRLKSNIWKISKKLTSMNNNNDENIQTQTLDIHGNNTYLFKIHLNSIKNNLY